MTRNDNLNRNNKNTFTMVKKTNIFFHAPKELTTDAFLVWLLYLLDSDKAYETPKQTFFDSLILKRKDCGRPVGNVELRRQENNVDVLLTFHFEDNNEQQTVLFEDKTWSMPHSDQLARYKKIYPDCYRYFYYKLAYIIIAELNRPQLKIKTSPNWILYQRRCSNPATPF